MTSISRLFYDRVCENPSHTALVYGEHVITYAGMLEHVQQQLAVFRGNQLQKDDRILAQLPNPLDFISLLLACADYGATMVPLNPKLPQEAILNVAQMCQTQLLLTDGVKIDASRNFNTRLRFEGKDETPLLLLTTSGSTGKPKPIILNQDTKLARINSLIKTYDIGPKDTILICTPLYHSMAQRLMLAGLITGAKIVVMDKWLPAEWCRQVYVHQATISIPVASQWKQLAGISGGVAQNYLASLQVAVSSSALMDEALVEQTSNWLPCLLENCYGTSEVAIATSGHYRCGTPVEGAEVRISPDGEIQVKSEMSFDGYLGLPEETAAAFTEDGWFRTGDLGRISTAGVLTYLGRIKEVIKVGGSTIYPEDIEAAISSHPAIEECAAFPKPDDTFGEVVAAVYRLREGKALSARNLLMHMIDQLTDEQLPRALYVSELPLPRTDSGKLQRVKLPEMKFMSALL